MVPAAAPAPAQYQRLAATATADLQALTLQQGPRKSTLGKIIHCALRLLHRVFALLFSLLVLVRRSSEMVREMTD